MPENNNNVANNVAQHIVPMIAYENGAGAIDWLVAPSDFGRLYACQTTTGVSATRSSSSAGRDHAGLGDARLPEPATSPRAVRAGEGMVGRSVDYRWSDGPSERRRLPPSASPEGRCTHPVGARKTSHSAASTGPKTWKATDGCSCKQPASRLSDQDSSKRRRKENGS